MTCASCGAQLEFRRGPWSFHVLKWISLIGWQIAVLAILALAFMHQWFWLATITTLAVGFEILRVVLVYRGAKIHWVNEESMRRRSAGQWVPD